MAEIKERSREEILKEKTERERFIVGCRMEKMQEEYENAVRNKRWDKNRECYVNREGEPVVPRRDIVHDDVRLKVADEMKVEVVEKEAVTEEQQVEEEIEKKEDVESDKKLVGDQVNTTEKEKMTEEGGITDKIQTESSELLNKNELMNNDTKIDKQSGNETENLMCTRNTYNMVSNAYVRVGVIERNISDMQDDIGNIREYMAGQGGNDDDDDDDDDDEDID
ncbi:transcription initiation factor IIE subunit alpha-like [Helianthus annuus]|uniref:transcription initiation factor IIE subunit alpha-like n=1 Tax=Helianthus annuus TaxID=4232 RepID=UPI000B905CEC|nr:transcription initiation factor IIE subunit alpha-like [Helianthus annuus]